MESNTLPAAIYTNMGPRMQGLEMSLQQQQRHFPQNPTSQMATAFSHHREFEQKQQHSGLLTQLPAMQDCYPLAANPKIQAFTLSDDDEPGHTATTENSADDGKRTMTSPSWHRMKWTDNMVRLLIMVVFYIGDEVSSEVNDPSPAGKKKCSALLQKKGKWKSVSTALIEKGFNVSPQQCEDKFNDLNKRYKRVNDVLGKGTACEVVKNQNLLETMDNLTPKMKEEAKKLLNSKHLFFKEMCAFHNGGYLIGCTNHQSPEIATEQSISVQQQPQPQPHQQVCHHSSAKAEENEDDEDLDDDDDEVDEDDDEDDEAGDKLSSKRQRIQKLSSELKKVLQDESKNAAEKRRWMKLRLMQLEEQHMGYDRKALEIEKQRFKWLKYKSKKEREMDRDKLIIERKKLENERMILLIRQKGLELIENHHYHLNRQSSSKTD